MRSGLELAKYNTLQPLEEKWQKLHKLSCFNFSLDVMFYYLIFHVLIFWSHLLIKWLKAAMHCCKRKIDVL